MECPTPFLEKRIYNISAKEDELYANYDSNHRIMRGSNAAVVCLHFDERRRTGMMTVIQYVLYLAILIVLAIPLGFYIKKVMNGEKTILSKVLTPCENLVYRVMRVDKGEQMTWKKYAVSVLIFRYWTDIPVPASACAGRAARQSARASRCEMGSGFQYFCQLCNQYKLAGVFG